MAYATRATRTPCAYRYGTSVSALRAYAPFAYVVPRTARKISGYRLYLATPAASVYDFRTRSPETSYAKESAAAGVEAGSGALAAPGLVRSHRRARRRLPTSSQ